MHQSYLQLLVGIRLMVTFVIVLWVLMVRIVTTILMTAKATHVLAQQYAEME